MMDVTTLNMFDGPVYPSGATPGSRPSARVFVTMAVFGDHLDRLLAVRVVGQWLSCDQWLHWMTATMLENSGKSDF